MGKTKRLAEESQERNSTPSETVLETRHIQLKGLPMEVFDSVYNYLGTRPHREVANLIKALDGSFTVNGTINGQNDQPS